MRLLKGLRFISGCGLVLSGLCADAVAQSSYLSATGIFSAMTGASEDFYLQMHGSGPEVTEFRTWAWAGGANAAGDTIASGGIDSIIELFNSGNASIGWNDDLGTQQRDSYLSPNGAPLPFFTYIPALGPGAYRLQLTAPDFAIGNGSWALDVTRQGTFSLDNRVGVSSSLGSLKFGSTEPGGMRVTINGGLYMPGPANVQSGGVLDVVGGTLRCGGVNVADGGQIDLHSNSMIVDYAASSPADSIRDQIIAHKITSSDADATHVLGYADNASLHATTFAGQSVDDTTVFVKYTFLGDSNLDGQVDITDLASLATAWQTAGVWVNGDFDYSGFVDITDLAALATNWQAGVGAPLAMSFEQALAQVGLAEAAVPEPATIAWVGAAGILGFASPRSSRRRAWRVWPSFKH